VVSVGVKASGPYPEQVWIEEMNKLEPLLKRREEDSVVETRDLNPSWEASLSGNLVYWASDGRRRGGMNSVRAFVRNCGNQSLRC